jgi:CO/xanthine dehydrogenase Mo-binding subunit
MSELLSSGLPRRDFLKAGGALVVGFAVAPSAFAQNPGQLTGANDGPMQPSAGELDTWIAIPADNTATIIHGHHELGQGISTTLLMIAAEELDMDMSQVQGMPLETGKSPNQGLTAASAGIARGGVRVRLAAADARQALLNLASTRLGAPVDRLAVSKGVVSVVGTSGKSVTYGELLGDRRFNVPFTGRAPIKDYRKHTIVGTPVPRRDVPAKAAGKYVYLQHIKVPGMLHGRVVRPRGQGSFLHGAKVMSIDPSSISGIAGARVVRRGDFIGVVAPLEWDAVKAAQQLKVTWDMPAILPASQEALHEQMRASKTVDRFVLDRGDCTAAFARAPHVASGRYDAPYQLHGPFAPNCAIADIKRDSALVYSSRQTIYGTRQVVCGVTGLKPETVVVRFLETSPSYGRGCQEDCAMAAAVMSQEAGAPVRLQLMRWDEHGWDHYQQAHTADVKIACDDKGKIVAYEYHGWQHNFTAGDTTEIMIGTKKPGEGDGIRAQGPTLFNTGDQYTIPNWRIVNHRVPGMNGYFKAAPLRSPMDIALSFAGEQTMDEVAYKAGIDAYQFRRQNINGERWLGVLDAVAKASKWAPRRIASNRQTGRVRTGRGIALGTHLSSYGAAVAEIEVDTETGVIVAKHMFGSLDPGQVINPGIVERQIEAQMCVAASRMLKEEVTFSTTNVTSLDWGTYQPLRFGEAPDVTAVVVNRPSVPASGAGEEALAAGAAAIANAFFDATGVRMHTFPLTPVRVLAALRSAAAKTQTA